jgi:hypothetical protein
LVRLRAITATFAAILLSRRDLGRKRGLRDRRGSVLYVEGNFDETIAEFRREIAPASELHQAIRLKPNFADAHIELGTLL